ncbi:MAG: ribosomal RNA small subunit methyltransferase A [Armatimonadetes bacterium]|nr:ribosomal RNA small subunit methyltransferase A [Armatimonadota bacterium]NCP31917.1 ribosomal RNA small subunit methyltransferase A [Armatimonadota bacterium]NCQ27009.1 ribosomal RNA small subunit methyltransferase A [Armatimonadota bacterium]NDK14461.1 ribosomal RNA small subunit methyltransferase A [Armatimonadota bacterium]
MTTRTTPPPLAPGMPTPENPNLCSTRVVRSLLAEHGVVPSRGRGQNFLIDRNTVERLLGQADLRGDETVLDLGTGLGVVAGALAPRVAQVIAVDIDSRLLEAAQAAHAGVANIRWVQGDLRELSLAELLAERPDRPASVVSNLPYCISKLVLRDLVTHVGRLRCAVLTVQREVGERMRAAPGGGDYGPLAVACALAARVSIEGTVSPNCFTPRPKVESAIMKLTPLTLPMVSGDEAADVLCLVRAAFAQRRKTLANALGASERWGPSSRAVAALTELGLGAAVRAEAVCPEEFVRLRRTMST